jgi:predicted nucleic acid-binding protein
VITAIDSNVLLDLVLAQRDRAVAAARALEESSALGEIVISDVATAEVVPGIGSMDPSEWFRHLEIRFDPILEETAIHAARLQARYLSRTGGPKRFVADLLVGAHALLQADRLLTRDRGFYRDYLKGLKLVEPRA